VEHIKISLCPDGEYEVSCADGATPEELARLHLLRSMFEFAWMWDGKKEYWPLTLNLFMGKHEWKHFIQDHVGEFGSFGSAVVGFIEHCKSCFGGAQALAMFDFDPDYTLGSEEEEC
jgi:hypothetical protein